jgi:hypothetical protein
MYTAEWKQETSFRVSRPPCSAKQTFPRCSAKRVGSLIESGWSILADSAASCDGKRLPAHIIPIDEWDAELRKEHDNLVVRHRAFREHRAALLAIERRIFGQGDQICVLASKLNQVCLKGSLLHVHSHILSACCS